jgi:xanthine dehydrogenase YagT iron-sulfur-binding subunit
VEASLDNKNCETHRGLSRRGFLSSVGTGAVVAATVIDSPASSAQEIKTTDKPVTISLRVNGMMRKVEVEARWTLLFVLREVLGLTGTKNGCERGECGACTVLVDGKARYACMEFAIEAEGHEITTLEGLMDGETLGPVQQAFADEDAFQCGFCTPGQIMAVESLLRQNPNPTFEEIRLGVSGNLCRCAAYKHIFSAAAKAAELKNAKGARP